MGHPRWPTNFITGAIFVNWLHFCCIIIHLMYTIGLRSARDVRLVTRDCPTPVWHLSSRTPEKSTLWTPWLLTNWTERFNFIICGLNRMEVEQFLHACECLGYLPHDQNRKKWESFCSSWMFTRQSKRKKELVQTEKQRRLRRHADGHAPWVLPVIPHLKHQS